MSITFDTLVGRLLFKLNVADRVRRTLNFRCKFVKEDMSRDYPKVCKQENVASA